MPNIFTNNNTDIRHNEPIPLLKRELKGDAFIAIQQQIRYALPNMKRSIYHLPYNPNLVKYARELRHNMTPAEKKLWFDFLRNFRARAYRQRPIDQFIVDFYIPSYKLIIELDGYHHQHPEVKDYDAERTIILESYGLEVIRFKNHDVLESFPKVCQAINFKTLK